MPHQDTESKTVHYHISGGHGGQGGLGHGNGGMGGSGGTGEGPTVIFGDKIVNQGQGLKEVLYKWLECPPDTKDRQYELQSLHHEATCHWLLQDVQFIRWKDTPGSLWIRGISGTGKSVLSSTVIEEITVACSKESAVAYFYFDFRNERQRMDIMLWSIIWQLSGQSPSPYSALNQLHKKLKNGTVKPQFIHLQAVLEDLLSELDQTYIVIDGLDECNKTDWKRLIGLLHSLYYPAKHALHLLFTSQPLEDFKTAFKNVPFFELGSVVSTGDIRSFIGNEVPKVGNWASDDKNAEQVTEQIVQKSNGMFRMAACLLIELGHCRWEEDWEETLTVLPADLFGIYSRFFTRAKDTPRLPTVFIQAIFQWLVFSARQITSDELADALAFRLDNPGFDFSDPKKSIYYPNRCQGNYDIFKLFEGLIIIKNNDCNLQSMDNWGLASLSIYNNNEPSIALAHSSVKDYILSPQFQGEFGSCIDLRIHVSHRFITQTCVRYLLLFSEPKHLMTRDTLPDYPMSLYAAKYWFHHLQLCNDQDQKALLPLTMYLLEDGSSQYTALYRLGLMPQYMAHNWDEPISPAICMCSEIGYTDGVHSLLIEHNASVDLVEKYEQTALHLALKNDHPGIARLLIEHNASVDLVNKDGQTALHLALKNCHPDIAKLLIEHNASVDLVEKAGWTALHFASENDHLDIVRLLIEHNASVDLVNKDEQTALHLALKNCHPDIARLLIECNASVDLVEKAGWTALHFASQNDHLDIVRLLIEHNASVDLVNKDVQTALHLALKNCHPDIARLLIEHNASVDLVEKAGWTALHIASWNGHLDIVRLLIEHNAFVDLVDKYRETALHLASRNGHFDIVKLLIEHNASVDLVEKAGWTALRLASRNGHLDIVRLLIEHNASVDLVNKDGQTALHLASRNGHLDIVRLLIEHNASVDLFEEDRWTALHLALENGHLEISKLLIEHGATATLGRTMSNPPDDTVHSVF
ncbi:HET-domain-containing protein [Mycena sanguinolenta]|uniref:HET-domain-containing protein n=1 Tax=Mycena sanguinolenta TaxID=230812 RepID=A0A8H6ZKI2_9AGAR|nr:HET-domain-containing protein [Mycena sanguinolenta]